MRRDRNQKSGQDPGEESKDPRREDEDHEHGERGQDVLNRGHDRKTATQCRVDGGEEHPVPRGARGEASARGIPDSGEEDAIAIENGTGGVVVSLRHSCAVLIRRVEQSHPIREVETTDEQGENEQQRSGRQPAPARCHPAASTDPRAAIVRLTISSMVSRRPPIKASTGRGSDTSSQSRQARS